MVPVSKKNRIVISNKPLLEAIEQLEIDVEKACEDAITVSGRNATNRYKKLIQDHHVTGVTEDSIVENPKVERKGFMLISQTGFDIAKGGAAAVYLDRGTPKQRPLNWLKEIKKDRAVKGAINYVLGEYWRGRR